jgi:hypothetical protein
MAKSRNNLLGVGGQRGRLPKNGPGSGGPHGAGDRQAAETRKQELARRMRERLSGTGSPAEPDTSGSGTEQSAGTPRA